EIKIIDKNTFALKTIDGLYQICRFNNTIENEIGAWKIIPTNKLNARIGSTINIQIFPVEIVSSKYKKRLEVSLLSKLSTGILLTINESNIIRGKDILDRIIHNYSQVSRLQQ